MKRHLRVHLKSKFSEITFSLTALSDTHSCCSKVPIPARCTFKRTPAVCSVTGCWMNSSTKTNHLYGGSFSEALLKGRMNYTAFNHVTGTGLLGINWESKLFSCCLCSRPLWLTADELTGFFSPWILLWTSASLEILQSGSAWRNGTLLLCGLVML